MYQAKEAWSFKQDMAISITQFVMEIILDKLNKISKQLQEQNTFYKEILTLEETSCYLQVSKSCLYKMTSNKEIPYYVPGGKKIYFKKKELDKWIENSRVAPCNELEEDIEQYLGGNIKDQSI